MTKLEFPPGFLWGAATAAFQVEGAAHQYGRKDSIWDKFARIPGAVIGGDNGDVACDQYHRYQDDVALMSDLNVQSYRFSTSWARVRPDGKSGKSGINQEGLDYYSRLVDSLLDNGITPWITLYHWDLPQALEDRGGWTNRDVAELFVEYAMTVYDTLGDRISTWTTLNEPWCSAFLGYTAGVHAPGRQDSTAGLVAGHHLLLAHGLAMAELRNAAPESNLGLTLNFTLADPVDPTDPRDVAAARQFESQHNSFFLDPLFRGQYPVDLMEALQQAGRFAPLDEAIHDGDLEIINAPIDALGVNYYHGEAVGHRPDPTAISTEAPVDRPTSSPFVLDEGMYVHSRGLPRTAQDWEIQPEGLRRLLVHLDKDYINGSNTRLYITENGAAFNDRVDDTGRVNDLDRLDYVKQHLVAVHEAIESGAPVDGYFAWSLLDNFEWAWGYGKRFGIVYVDFTTQERIIKASGRWYSQVSRENAVTV
ncbi:beta-glucosidase [Micrococcales bacterium KH10]|nr:beta-glucosidase [Micrococcales bacterium KH10]